MHNETIPAPLLHRDPDRKLDPPADSALVLRLMAGVLFVLIFLIIILPALR